MSEAPRPAPTTIPPELYERFGPFVAPPKFDGTFSNPWSHASVPTLTDVLRWKTRRNRVRPAGYRAAPEQVIANPLGEFERMAGAATRLLWIGHASFLLELDGVRLVVDPVFGRAGGLVPRVTPAALEPGELRGIHAILITHGHHDHFDPKGVAAIARAQEEPPVLVVPRGLGVALPSACQRVVELSWWEHIELGTVRVHLVPAQHWHRRSAFDGNRALWGGFVMEGTHRIHHSGDTGYFDGFRAIGEVFGGMDAACLPLGAYEPAWFMGPQHMAPQEALQAAHDLRARHFVGMHWGAYDLSDEPLDAGPRWLLDTVRTQGLPEGRFHVLAPGGSLALAGPRGSTRAEARFPWEEAG